MLKALSFLLRTFLKQRWGMTLLAGSISQLAIQHSFAKTNIIYLMNMTSPAEMTLTQDGVKIIGTCSLEHNTVRDTVLPAYTKCGSNVTEMFGKDIAFTSFKPFCAQ